LDVAIDGNLYSIEVFLEELLNPSLLQLYHRAIIILFVTVFSVYIHFSVKTLAKNEKKIQRLSQQLILSQEEERKHIAHELHDGLGQSLTHIHTTATVIAQQSGEKETVRRADEISQSTQHVFAGLRNILNTIDPHLIAKLGLVPVVKSLIENRQQHSGLNCTLNHSGKLDGLPYMVSICAYRIIQECLINTSKHADASEIEITLSVIQKRVDKKESDFLQLEVHDNGLGTELNSPNSKGIGLISICERAQALQGSCEINSAPGKGMHVSIQIPLSERL